MYPQRSPAPAGPGNDQPLPWGKKKKFLPWMLPGYSAVHSSGSPPPPSCHNKDVGEAFSGMCASYPAKQWGERSSRELGRYEGVLHSLPNTNYITKFQRACQRRGRLPRCAGKIWNVWLLPKAASPFNCGLLEGEVNSKDDST